MSTSRKILIIGGGPAGAWAAISAKKQDPAADVALLTDEHHEPYEKPPLSKGVLMGKAKFDDALIAGPKGLAGHNVVLEKRAVCTAIDRKGKTVATKGGKTYPYDALVLATGSLVRELPPLPLGMPRVHYLRTEAHAHSLKRELEQAKTLVVVGAGAVADTALAAAAGLACDNGIVVDEHGRTSDPDIFAAGDVVRFPGPHGLVRLEDWRHAQDHGAVAGKNAAGASEIYKPVPSFWSEQYDLYLQGVGWAPPKPGPYLHRPLTGNASIVFQMDGPHLAYALAINAQRDIATARRLIERKIPVDAAALVDPARPLADMLKAKAS